MAPENHFSIRLFVRKTQKRAIISGIIIGLILSVVWSWLIGFGFLAGVAVSVINFQLMAVDAFGITDKAPKKARRFILGRYALRYAIMFGFIALIALRTEFNIFATFTGLFFVQVLLVAGHVFSAAKIGGRIFKGLS